jgi:hypothetical protein
MLIFGLATAWIWFMSLVAVESILLFILIEGNKPGWCAISLLSTFGLLKFLAGVNIPLLAWEHPGLAVLFILGYFLVGTIWSIGKWYLFVKDRRAKYDEAKANWSPDLSRGGKIYANVATEWEKSHEYLRFKNSKNGLAPLVRDNKSRILTWMGYWPWSMLWTLINDPIKRAFKTIYNHIHDTLQSISNSAFKDVQ